jgi:hypothetical protein
MMEHPRLALAEFELERLEFQVVLLEEHRHDHGNACGDEEPTERVPFDVSSLERLQTI